jgi:P27 family predicted phage terminase small subunit
MVTGRKPKPTHLKLITGARLAAAGLTPREPKVARARLTPPAHLSVEACVEWERIAEELYSVGLMTPLDRAAVAAYCQAYGRWQQAENALAAMAARDELTHALMIKTSNGNAIQNPLVGTANKAAIDMVRYAAELGMTPSARSRIAATPPHEGEADPAAKYLA